MSDDKPVQLEYAPPVPGPTRRARRWLVIVAVLLALSLVVQWAPSAFTRARLLWVQHRVAAFEYPAGAVVYDSDRTAGQSLLADPANYVALDDTSVWPTRAVARREPPPWASMKSILFAGQTFWPPGPAAPKVLVHRLRNARGAERLIAIIVAPESARTRQATPATGQGELGLVAAVIRPGGWDAAPQWEGNGTFFKANFGAAKRLRFFAATVDPADRARFTVPYEIDGQKGAIDGKYQDDGDVTFAVRSGPATRAAR